MTDRRSSHICIDKYLISKWKLASCAWAWSPLSSLTMFFSFSPSSHISFEFITSSADLCWHIREALSPWKTYGAVTERMIKYTENINLKRSWKVGRTLKLVLFYEMLHLMFYSVHKVMPTFHFISTVHHTSGYS